MTSLKRTGYDVFPVFDWNNLQLVTYDVLLISWNKYKYMRK